MWCIPPDAVNYFHLGVFQAATQCSSTRVSYSDVGTPTILAAELWTIGKCRGWRHRDVGRGWQDPGGSGVPQDSRTEGWNSQSFPQRTTVECP